MEIKKDTKVRVTYRPELGSGAVLQVAEALDGYTQVDVVFEKDGKRFLETFPRSLVTPVADIFQRYQNNESDHPTDFFLKQLAYQLPLENFGGELSNSKTDLLPHQGKAYHFWSLIQLMDDQLFEKPEAMLDHRGFPGSENGWRPYAGVNL